MSQPPTAGDHRSQPAQWGPRTRAVHAGEPSPRVDGSVTLPIFQSSTYLERNASNAADVNYHDVRYVRLNNTPNHDAVAEKIAALEAVPRALVAASGMAAISTALLTLLSQGDHVIAQRSLYGGTRELFDDVFPRFGISVTRIDPVDPSRWREALTQRTRVFYVESIDNPLLGVPALSEVAQFCRDHDLTSVIDNTFASPANFRPASIGIDVVLHSATKILNGHSDIAAGVIAGSSEFIDRSRRSLSVFGACLDPNSCFLLQRGLKTYPLRCDAWNENGLALARFLEQHEAVDRVHYPGLESDPHHARATTYFDGFGGMVSFRMTGDGDRAETLLEHLELGVTAPSLGGTETLVTRPIASSHAGLPESERRALGIDESLIRVSCGLEDSSDLIRDFEQAISASR